MVENLINFIRTIGPWAPIPLFAESLRSQGELVSAIMTREYLPACMTGCVRDFGYLWNIDYLGIFGHSQVYRPHAVTSVRHGNVFDLANGAILDNAGMTTRHNLLASDAIASETFRETVINLTFITPSSEEAQMPNTAKRWATISLLFLEMLSIVFAAILVYGNGVAIGAALLVCISCSQLLLFGLKILHSPIFGNQAAVESDRTRTARRGAALDVHVIADSWNSPRLSVICGYSSQLHALTNIPIRTTRPFALKWICRALAIVLTIQAALLAAVTNAEGRDRWSSLLWLAFYLLILGLKKSLHVFISPENLLEKQPASIQTVGPLRFSGRRQALVFISMLPVTQRVDRWAWWDVFMPDNDRRRRFHAELEDLGLFSNATRWQDQVSNKQADGEEQVQRSAFANDILQEAANMLNGPLCSAHLKNYLEKVLPSDGSLELTKSV